MSKARGFKDLSDPEVHEKYKEQIITCLSASEEFDADKLKEQITVMAVDDEDGDYVIFEIDGEDLFIEILNDYKPAAIGSGHICYQKFFAGYFKHYPGTYNDPPEVEEKYIPEQDNVDNIIEACLAIILYVYRVKIECRFEYIDAEKWRKGEVEGIVEDV